MSDERPHDDGAIRPTAWLVRGATVLASAEIADDRVARVRGLLGRDEVTGAFVLPNTRWVHTIGMRCPIDVAYVAADGTILKIARMGRHRIGAPVRRASFVVEAAAGSFDRWSLRTGDVVELRT